jgi:hypothetical protein
MSSVSLLTSKLQASRLEAAERSATERGGAVHLVPSPFPDAPSPFDFQHGGQLAASGYRRTVTWLAERREKVDRPQFAASFPDDDLSQREDDLRAVKPAAR